MQKKIIALAVAGALVAPAAMAEVSLYGAAHVDIGSLNNGSKGALNVTSNQSRFGLKAAEDLGGLTAVAQMEFAVNVADTPTSGILSGRNSFVALAGGFGTVLAGRHDAPNKISTGGLDIFADTVADYNAIVGVNGATDVRVDNAIAWVAPAVGGATVILAMVPDTSAGTDKDKGEELSATSAAVLWGAGPLAVDFGYANAKNLPGTAAAGGFIKDAASAGGALAGVVVDAVNTRIGVGYTVSDALKVGFVYDTVEFKAVGSVATGAKLKYTDYLVNAAFDIGGGNTLKAEYGSLKGDSANPLTNGTTTLMAVGIDHAFSKTTNAYVVYASLANDDKMLSTLGTVGSGHNIQAAAGKDPNAISVGMVVKF